jgi:hypothetical protein
MKFYWYGKSNPVRSIHLKPLYFNSDSSQKYAEIIFYREDPQTLPRHAGLVTAKFFACIEILQEGV